MWNKQIKEIQWPVAAKWLATRAVTTLIVHMHFSYWLYFSGFVFPYISIKHFGHQFLCFSLH